MEVVEHVVDPDAFLGTCAGLLQPGGLLIVSTINRTMKAFALAIVGAEYVLGWLPRGTHQWDKFVTPAEIEAALTPAGLDVLDRRGVVYNPLFDDWRLSSDLDVNYMIALGKIL
jgi:2-polyprenyl-6-hydroxyphenyl methylase / 3-demethylubiquinone-9 3-methyltransferase